MQATMFCTSCGHEVQDGTKYCGQCGALRVRAASDSLGPKEAVDAGAAVDLRAVAAYHAAHPNSATSGVALKKGLKVLVTIGCALMGIGSAMCLYSESDRIPYFLFALLFWGVAAYIPRRYISFLLARVGISQTKYHLGVTCGAIVLALLLIGAIGAMHDAELARLPTWTDPRTGLMWAKQDNGSNVDWYQASNYCQNLTLGGYSNWRLPTIDELAGIYDPTQDVNGHHIKGHIQRSAIGGVWSNTAGTDSGEAWFFHSATGERTSVRLGVSDPFTRALCVRGAEPAPSSSQTRSTTSASANTAPPNEAQLPTWTDPQTRLMWAKQDNGSDVGWNEASNYCQNLTLSGHSNWRLPTIDELAGIYDPTRGVNGLYGRIHIKGNIQLSTLGGWSNSAGTASGEAFFFNFRNGFRMSNSFDFSSYGRALCVRDAEPAPSSSLSSSSTNTALPATWNDSKTGLVWAKQDNGSDVDWHQANYYCQNLTLGGYSKWRLPTIDELAGIYDPKQDVKGWQHIKGHIQLTTGDMEVGVWSNTTDGTASGAVWLFYYFSGGRAQLLPGSTGDRALCVRRSGE